MYIQWSPAFELGIPEIDGEHRHLAAIVNAFYDGYRAGGGRDKIFAVLNLLVKYVEVHFRNEEALMEAGRYPDLLRHRREHERLTAQIFALAEKHEAGDGEICIAVMEFLKGWLIEHILHEDKKIAAHLAERAVPCP